MSPLRVLVTGGTGFVGSHVVHQLSRHGFEVRLLCRTPTKARPVLAALGTDVPEVLAGDMTDAAAVATALAGCDAVIHCAAEIGVSGGSAALGDVNLAGARTVLGLAADAGLDPIVYASSIAAYLPTDDETLTPDTSLAVPLSAYGAQKRDVELFARELAAGGSPVTSFVLGGVYGPVSPHLDGSFSAICGALAAGMVAPPGGTGVVDVRDVAVAMTRACEAGHGARRFLMSGQFVSWQEWTDLLSWAAGVPVPFTEVTTELMRDLGRQFDDARRQGREVPPLTEEAAVIMAAGRPGDDSATLRALGLSYRPLEETFQDTLQWLRANEHVPAG